MAFVFVPHMICKRPRSEVQGMLVVLDALRSEQNVVHSLLKRLR